MSLFRVFAFFNKEINLKIRLKILLSFFLNGLLIFSEIGFLSVFFLLLNQRSDSISFNFFFKNLNNYYSYFVDKFSMTELYIFILIFFLVIKNILTLLNHIYFSNFIFKLSADKSAQILKFYMNKSYDVFFKKEISIYTKQLVRDVENVFSGIFGLIISFISELIYVFTLLYFISNLIEINLTYESYLLSLAVISILYLLFVASRNFGELRATNEIKVFKTLSDTLNIFKEIKLTDSTNAFVSRYKYFLNQYYNSRIFSGAINLSPKFIFESFLLLLFFFIYKNDNSFTNFNDFVLKYSVVVLALLRLIPSFAKLASYFGIILFNLNSIKFIENDLKKMKADNENKNTKKNKIESIELKSVCLNFIKKNNSKLSKKNRSFNLLLNKNNIYGIYGESGSGKTSLLNLLSGFIKPDYGKVLVNQKQIDFYKITEKYKIGYLPQSPTILDDNIELNVTLKHSNTPQVITGVKNYLMRFNLKKFLRNKYFQNSNKSISSVKSMSGGEKQRVAFIRTVISNPDLILLDEPTSSLDKKNEKKIFQFLTSIKKDKIIVITSHNKYQKKFFDKIIYL